MNDVSNSKDPSTESQKHESPLLPMLVVLVPLVALFFYGACA